MFKALVGLAVGLTGGVSGAICIRDGETFRYRAGAGPGVIARSFSAISKARPYSGPRLNSRTSVALGQD